LKAQETVQLARPRIVEKTRHKPVAAAIALDSGEQRLFESLRRLRKQLAEERGVPPYVIFGDATLVEMSRQRPGNEAEFLAINGVGQVKLERHGAAFLQAIASDALQPY
jgi:ATP-dependent DNA helicase RecQ